MMNTECNGWSRDGWTNYETWCVNGELFDGMTPEDFGYLPGELVTLFDRKYLSHSLHEYAYDVVEGQAKGWARHITKGFLAKVDWDEIAQRMMYDFATA